MKNILLLFILSCSIGLSQSAVVEIPLTLTDAAGDSTTLWFGLDPSASDGIDVGMGEDELPPFPPKKVFEARFVGDDIDLPQLGLGSYKDVRNGDDLFSGEMKHEIRFQTFNNSKLVLDWDLPQNVTGRLVDIYGGTYVNKPMAGKGQLSISLVAVVDRLLMSVNYKAPSITVAAPNGGEVWRIYADAVIEWSSEFVEKDVTIYLSRDNGLTFDSLAQTPNSGSYAWNVAGPPSDECWLKIVDASGRIVDQSDAPFSIQFTTGVKSECEPTGFYVSPNYPNPFNPKTTIEFYAPRAETVRAEIFNAAGQHVRILADRYFKAGGHSLVWNGRDDSGAGAAGGVYFYRISANDEIRIGKMILAP